MKKIVLLTCCFAVLTLFAIPAAAEILGSPDPIPSMRPVEGLTAGTGTVFEITGSDYLDVTLTSSLTITASVHSFPEEVNIRVDPVGPGVFTTLTLSGLQPDTTYYLSIDGSGSTAVTSDSIGNYTFALDLSDGRIVFLMAHSSTIYLRDTGWSPPSVGAWDPVNRVATLSTDVNDTIWVYASGATLDGQGHAITGTSSDVGVRLLANNVTVKNVTVTGFFSYGFIGHYGGGRITNSTIQTQGSGIFSWDTIQIDNNLIDSRLKGIELSGADHCEIFNNVIDGHLISGIRMSNMSDYCSIYENDISNNNFGVSLSHSNNSIFYNNNFVNNQSSGSGSTNQIHDHLYIDRFSSGVFSLDLPVGGNHWTEHNGGSYHGAPNGVDADGNGFYDYPYYIVSELTFNFGGIDYYPYASLINWSGNKPPVLGTIGDQVVNEGELLQFTVTASDLDGDNLTFSAVNLPMGASFDPATATFSWMPNYDQFGIYTNVEFSVTDDGDPIEVDSELSTITVGNVNRPPVITPVGSQYVEEYQTLEFTILATDPDGDSIVLSAGEIPSFAVFEPATGLFSWSPDGTQVGSYTITFYAADDGSPTETGETQVQISVADLPPGDLADDLVNGIINDDLDKDVENSYLANLKKVSIFIEDGKITAASNQVEAFINKVQQDLIQGLITQEEADRYLAMANEIITKLVGQ